MNPTRVQELFERLPLVDVLFRIVFVIIFTLVHTNEIQGVQQNIPSTLNNKIKNIIQFDNKNCQEKRLS